MSTLSTITSSWFGVVETYRVQIFFPKLGKPQRQDIQKQANKIYPGARILSYVEASRSPDLPMLFAIDYF